MSGLSRLISMALVVSSLAASGWAGWHMGRVPLREENAALRTSYAEASRLAAIASARRLQAAQERSDVLGGQLAQALASNAQLTREKTHALSLVATGRTCLSGRVLGVLDGAPGIRLGRDANLPEAKPGTDAAYATAAADPHPATSEGGRDVADLEATDADVGGWVIAAGAHYEECRQRLNALIDWHAQPTEPAAEATDER